MKIVIPPYQTVRAGTGRAMVTGDCAPAIRQILEKETLYEFAARQPDARVMTGRAPVFAIELPMGCGRVVVRHSMRGGLAAKVTQDLFILPTRGLRELMNSLRLRASGVSTPEVVAYVSYAVGGIFRRSDVATREIPDGHDLSTVLHELKEPDHRRMAFDAIAKLLKALSHAGAHHQDLNLKNILLTSGAGEGLDAHVLDIDRVRFSSPESPLVAKANLDRLLRSLRKWHDAGRIRFAPEDETFLRQHGSEVRS